MKRELADPYDMATLDRDWHIGVPGWKLEDGRHVRLRDVLELADDEERPRVIQEHRNACALLALVLAKLNDELNEVEP